MFTGQSSGTLSEIYTKYPLKHAKHSNINEMNAKYEYNKVVK
jgi:hypothetical protein